MRIPIQKKLWWTTLIVGCGGTAATIGLLLVHELNIRHSRQYIWYVWPFVIIASILALRRCYRIEPMQDSGILQLNLADLLGAVFYFGLILAGMKSVLLPEHFLNVGIIVATINTVTFVTGLLTATRKGIRRWKFAFACSVGVRTIGLWAVGTVLAVSLTDEILYRRPWHWLSDVLFTHYSWDFLYFPYCGLPCPFSEWPSYWIPDREIWGVLLHRIALYEFPLGLILHASVKRILQHISRSKSTVSGSRVCLPASHSLP